MTPKRYVGNGYNKTHSFSVTKCQMQCRVKSNGNDYAESNVEQLPGEEICKVGVTQCIIESTDIQQLSTCLTSHRS